MAARKQRFNCRFLLFGALAVLYFFSRLYRLRDFPLFADEAFYVIRAEEIAAGESIFSPLHTATQPLFIWLTVLMMKLVPDGILAARLISVLAGLAAAFGLARLTKFWLDSKISWLAFLAYTILPFSLVYDRLAMLESLVNAMIIWSMIFPLAGVAAALLTKATGWVAVPVSLGVFSLEKRWRQIVMVFLGIGLTWGIWGLAFRELGAIGSMSFFKPAEHLSFGSYLIKPNIFRAKLWLIAYLTRPVILAATGGLVITLLNLKKVKMQKIFVLFCISVGFLIFAAAVGRDFYPRYLFPLIPATVLLISALMNWVKQRWGVFIVVVLTVVIFWPSAKFMIVLISDPQTAPLALEDRVQFFEDWTAGTDIKAMAGFIDSYIPENQSAIIFLEPFHLYDVGLKYSPPLRERKIVYVTLKELLDPLDEFPDGIIQDSSDYRLIIRNKNPGLPQDWPVKLVKTIKKSTVREVEVYRVQ